MASIGHVLVGAAAARVRSRPGTTGALLWAAVGWSALSLLPDVDVIGFRLGVRYSDPWGHRGATHSFAFAILVSVAVAINAAAARLPVVKTSLMTLAVVSSHALLDTLTDGGLGCALLWPF